MSSAWCAGTAGDQPAPMLRRSSSPGFSCCGLAGWQMDLNGLLSRHAWGEARQQDIEGAWWYLWLGARAWSPLPGLPCAYWKGHLGGVVGLISGRDSTDLCGGSLQPGPLLQVTPRAHLPWSKGSHLPELHLSNEGAASAQSRAGAWPRGWGPCPIPSSSRAPCAAAPRPGDSPSSAFTR